MNIYNERILALRSLMKHNGWDAVIITGSDPHASEYTAPRWQQVAWFSGFTGEAGDLVVTMYHAGLWTDSRFFIQAAEQLEGTCIELHKTRVPGAVGIPEWLEFKDISVIALDGQCQTASWVMDLCETVSRTHECTLIDAPDLLPGLWTDRPDIPVSPIITLSEENVGMSRYDKLTDLRKFLILKDCDSILISALDEIAWLLNIRGEDISYNPYVISYLFVSQSEALWFVTKNDDLPDQDTEDSFRELQADRVSIMPYRDLKLILQEIFEAEEQTVFLDPSTLNFSVYKEIEEMAGKDNIVNGRSPVPLWKSVKNETEIEGMREAFLEDGVAMEKFFFWLETSVRSGVCVTEWDASEKLKETAT